MNPSVDNRDSLIPPAVQRELNKISDSLLHHSPSLPPGMPQASLSTTSESSKPNATTSHPSLPTNVSSKGNSSSELPTISHPSISSSASSATHSPPSLPPLLGHTNSQDSHAPHPRSSRANTKPFLSLSRPPRNPPLLPLPSTRPAILPTPPHFLWPFLPPINYPITSHPPLIPSHPHNLQQYPLPFICPPTLSNHHPQFPFSLLRSLFPIPTLPILPELLFYQTLLFPDFSLLVNTLS